LPVLFLQKEVETEGMSANYAPVLCSLDIKYAFLQVPQKDPIQVDLHGVSYVILKNLPGQRQGAREWYWHFRQFLTDELGFSWCDIQPCLAKTPQGIVLLHVDDVLFCGSSEYFHKVFLEKCQKRFSTSYALLKDVGSSISFLKKMVRLKDGILLVPGTNTERIVEAFETEFGPSRIQAVPCDSSIQLEDASQCLTPSDSSKFRSIVGMCLYLGRDRPDVVFAIKELASKMSKPTCTSLQHLRKLVGYLKGTGELGVKLQCPTPRKESGKQLRRNVG
jgi:hypothetical protein